MSRLKKFVAPALAAAAVVGLSSVAMATDPVPGVDTFPTFSTITTEMGRNVYPMITAALPYIGGALAFWGGLKLIKRILSRTK